MDKPSEQMRNAILKSKLKTVRELLEIVPVDCVYALINNLGGCTMTFPRINSFVTEERNEKIRKDYFNGKTLNELAKEYHLTTRYINGIINKNK